MNKYFVSNIALVFIFLFLPTSSLPFDEDNKDQFNTIGNNNFRSVETFIIWNYSAAGEDSIDQLSFENAFMSIGLAPTLIPSTKFSTSVFQNNSLIIIPHASALLLNEKEIHKIKQLIKDGVHVISDGNSRLTKLMNIRLSRPTKVNFVNDLNFQSALLQWADTPKVSLIMNKKNKSTSLVYVDSASGYSVGILKNFGKGKFLFLSTLFDPITGEGYSRFPNLPNFVVKQMNCIPLLKRRGIDAYFDPGYYHDMPIEKLVANWKSWGIKAIHAAAWYYYDSPSYNYEHLISEAHKQGILVYAWLEWPYLGMGFWDAHPEWRMKNALLLDAQLDFLSLMDLQNPDCMRRALSDLSALLKYDWDGIDIAEFSITGGVSEALEGPAQPKYFTGFNTTARNEFKSLYGFDQTELFNESSEHFWKTDSIGLDKFYKYRVQVNNQLLRQIVSSLDSLRSADNRLIFTVLDNSLHPEFDQLLGFDLSNTLKLAKEFHATLQVEDPASEWTRPPSRYDQLAKTYSILAPDIPLAIDINVVPVHPIDQKGFASAQPTGTELFRQFSFADNNCGRVCFYAESSVYKYDWEVFPYVMASNSTVIKDKKFWRIITPHTAIMPIPANQKTIFLDSLQWPCYGKEGIIIPKGEHILSFSDSVSSNINKKYKLLLTGISDELISCDQLTNGIEVVYQSPSRCLITLNRVPQEIKVDGKTTLLRVLKEADSCTIFAPSGKHRLQLYQ